MAEYQPQRHWMLVCETIFGHPPAGELAIDVFVERDRPCSTSRSAPKRCNWFAHRTSLEQCLRCYRLLLRSIAVAVTLLSHDTAAANHCQRDPGNPAFFISAVITSST